MTDPIRIIIRDESHLKAHTGDFTTPLETLLDWARGRLAARPRRSGVEHLDFRAPSVVGLTGLATIHRWTRGDFWGPREGRTIPSHLIVGRKRPTRWLCIWGEWRDERTFLLYTLYPGRVAPREIHDPSIPPEELPEAIRFWARHAIVVDRMR